MSSPGGPDEKFAARLDVSPAARQRSRRGRRHVAVQRLSSRQGEDDVRLRADAGVARSSAAVFGRSSSDGSGSFVSPDGLIMTNHHIGLDCLQNLSTADRDYVKTGFYAKTQAEEGKCPNLEINVLAGIEDVTAKVNAAATPGMSTAEARQAQRAAMSAIEQECSTGGLRCDVITLYQGGDVPPLSVQEVHGRSPGVRAGGRHRVLRRRSGQLRIPTIRSRHHLLPRLRKRQARADRASFHLVENGCEGGRTGVRLRASRFDRPHVDGRPDGVPARPAVPLAAQVVQAAYRRLEGFQSRSSGERTDCAGRHLRPRERTEGDWRFPGRPAGQRVSWPPRPPANRSCSSLSHRARRKRSSPAIRGDRSTPP